MQLKCELFLDFRSMFEYFQRQIGTQTETSIICLSMYSKITFMIFTSLKFFCIMT